VVTYPAMHRAVILALAALTPATAQVTISAKPDTVEPGGAITLVWKSPGPAAYIDGIGLVPPSGSKTISPRASGIYTLISEGPIGIQYSSVRVQMMGERGDPVFPDPDDFPPGVADRRTSMAYTDFLNLTFKTLQDEMSHRIRGQHLPDQSFYVFFTDRRERPDLLRPSDRGIRSRRVAYWVRIEEPHSHKDVPFEVKAIVEYQRLAESRWRPETDQQLVTGLATSLKQKLLTAQVGVSK
jgi:hypothetical protein